MATTNSVGTTIKISAGTPATWDGTGYAALTYTTVGEVISIPEFGGETNISSYIPLSTGVPVKFKGSKDLGELSIPMSLDSDNAGQILMKEAEASLSNYSFLITFPNGDKTYFRGLVRGFKPNPSGADDVLSATAMIAVNASPTGVGFVEVLAA